MIRRMASMTAASATYNHQARRTKSEKTVDLAMIFSLLSFCENNFYKAPAYWCADIATHNFCESSLLQVIYRQNVFPVFPRGAESELSKSTDAA
jgi:hypothetical protein